ncbi:hypothetical protein [Methylomonas sp. AM2-LC]|uniref:hypothetical protein n=1 Tax=Methylomonas sp. AM2-LC TaxID=3153301 RepID=UPI003263C72B
MFKQLCKLLTLTALQMFWLPATYADIVNGDFSQGNSGFTSDYTYDFPIRGQTKYSITLASQINAQTILGDWPSISALPNGLDGNVLLADGATFKDYAVWKETITVTPFTDYRFSFYTADVDKSIYSSLNANISIELNGAILSTLNTTQSWQLGQGFFNSGNQTSVNLSLVDANISASGNDFAIANINLVAAPVPTPTSLLLFLSGIGIMFNTSKSRHILRKSLIK